MPARDGREATRRYLAKPGNYEKHKIGVKNRVLRNLELLPELFDECDVCGIQENLKVLYVNDDGRHATTTLVSKIWSGWGMERAASFVHDNDLLCVMCATDVRKKRKADLQRERNV